MALRESFLLLTLFLAPLPSLQADVFTFQLTDNHMQFLGESPRMHNRTNLGGILDGPGPGIGYAASPTLYSLFGEPFQDNSGAGFTILGNLTASGTQTEIFANSNPIDLSPIGCSSISWCRPAKNGQTYLIEQLQYTDGSSDSIYFQWTQTPEPKSILLLTPIILGVLVLYRRKQSPTVGLP